MNRFSVWAALMAVFIIAIFYTLDRGVESVTTPWVVYGFVVVFAVFTAVIHHILVRTNEKNPKLFITYFMGSISLKLFLTLIFLLLYIFFNPHEKIVVGIGVLVVYISFTAFETISLYNKLTARSGT